MTNEETAKLQAFKNADFTNIVQAKTAWEMGWDAAVQALSRKHVYWGAGEPNCPREIKAGNGELHTLRCKVCGQDSPKSFCAGNGVRSINTLEAQRGIKMDEDKMLCQCGHYWSSHRDKGYDADIAGSMPGQGSCTEDGCSCTARDVSDIFQ